MWMSCQRTKGPSMYARLVVVLVAALSMHGSLRPGGAADNVGERPAWREFLVANFRAGPLQAVAAAQRAFPESQLTLDAVADWIAQDQLAAAPGGVVHVLAARTAAPGRVHEAL